MDTLMVVSYVQQRETRLYSIDLPGCAVNMCQTSVDYQAAASSITLSNSGSPSETKGDN